MKFGITYDLQEEYLKEGYSPEEAAEFDKPVTIEAIENALHLLGHTTERIGNHKALIGRLARGDRWEIVFNICEGLYGIGREALVPNLLDAYRIPYVFSDPMVLALCLHKGMTKRVVRDAGVPTADFAVVSSLEDLENIHLDFPLFAKPVAEGTGKGIDILSKITSQTQLADICQRLIERFHQPVIIEEFLPGREFTVGITGTGRESEVAGVMEIAVAKEFEEGIYSYSNKENYTDRVEYRLIKGALADECAAVALNAWRALGCRDGGRIDIKLDRQGNASFIEVNPLAGLNPLVSDLPMLCRFNGISYDALIAKIVRSALQRIER